MDKLAVITAFLSYIVIYNIPLLYGTVGEIVVEKSGSLNLGVEGTMAVGAIFGYVLGCYTNSLVVGILTAFAVGALFGLLFAFLTVSLHANQNITGLAITTFGLGIYSFVGKLLQHLGKFPTKMSDYSNIQNGFYSKIKIPLLSKIPVLGEGLFSHNILIYLGIAIAVAMWFYMNKTSLGLRLRSVGENPAAADAVGINITLVKYLNIMLGCGIMGIGGYYMAMHMDGSFSSVCWINGYGWISVALVIFANWSPAMAILGTFVFGFFRTLEVSGGSMAMAFPKMLGWLSKIPEELYEALPFIITAVVLIVTSISKKKNSGQPAALGVNYFREDR